MGFKWTAAGPGLRAARAIVACHTQPVSGRVVCGSAGAPLRPSWLLLLLLLSYLASARCCRRRGRCGEILMRRTGRPIVLRHVQSLPRGARAVAPVPRATRYLCPGPGCWTVPESRPWPSAPLPGRPHCCVSVRPSSHAWYLHADAELTRKIYLPAPLPVLGQKGVVYRWLVSCLGLFFCMFLQFCSCVGCFCCASLVFFKPKPG